MTYIIISSFIFVISLCILGKTLQLKLKNEITKAKLF